MSKTHPTVTRGRQVREQILDFIVRYQAEHGWAPSYQEIANEIGLVDRGTVHKHMHTLEREGRIVLGGGPRMIRVVRNVRS